MEVGEVNWSTLHPCVSYASTKQNEHFIRILCGKHRYPSTIRYQGKNSKESKLAECSVQTILVIKRTKSDFAKRTVRRL